ncbi:hypothetical protein PanWU01x14_316770 [Parasponia andersonii]|uniref:Uncharacterized protein n=1 Tax=Parasponia andersonii TaxID=3476 RepID=A0A2P5AMR4_PARAD|nr:hypothetical protein PanWU01x14_316770 [Parasponia andersonii]
MVQIMDITISGAHRTKEINYSLAYLGYTRGAFQAYSEEMSFHRSPWWRRQWALITLMAHHYKTWHFIWTAAKPKKEGSIS